MIGFGIQHDTALKALIMVIKACVSSTHLPIIPTAAASAPSPLLGHQLIDRLRAAGFTDPRHDSETRDNLIALRSYLSDLHDSYAYTFLVPYIADDLQLVDRVLSLATILGQDSVVDTCLIVRQRVLILELTHGELVRRLMELKQHLPKVRPAADGI